MVSEGDLRDLMPFQAHSLLQGKQQGMARMPTGDALDRWVPVIILQTAVKSRGSTPLHQMKAVWPLYPPCTLDEIFKQ